MDASPAIWEEDERSHRSGVGRWAFARDLYCFFAYGKTSRVVVLKVAGLPEPS